MQNGWVKLHRGLLEWEWYDDINTCRLFVHCLLRANHADKTWRGKDIKRGSFFTSLDTLSTETGLTPRQIRTSLDKLISTNELASSGQARGRMISIVKYDSYQSDDKLNDSQKAGKRQADDRVVTANKNDKNEKNEKNVINNIFSESGMNDDQISEIIRIRKKNKGGVISERVAKSLIKEFVLATKIGWELDDSITEWDSRGWKSFKSEWLTDKRKNNEINGNTTTQRPDNSAAGRVRANGAKRKAEIAEALAEIERNDRSMADDGQPIRTQVGQLIR